VCLFLPESNLLLEAVGDELTRTFGLIAPPLMDLGVPRGQGLASCPPLGSLLRAGQPRLVEYTRHD
jgi:hypothetical protein